MLLPVASSPLERLRDLLGGLAVPVSVIESIVEIVRAETPFPIEDEAASEPRQAVLAQFARRLYKFSRSRSQVIGDKLCPDPAWNMLLDLYASDQEGRPVSVSSLCIASGSPPTTGLRYLELLCDAGLVERRPDRRDGRRVLVHMTEAGRMRLTAFVQDAMNQGPRRAA